jgi:hypothetical protein
MTPDEILAAVKSLPQMVRQQLIAGLCRLAANEAVAADRPAVLVRPFCGGQLPKGDLHGECPACRRRVVIDRSRPATAACGPCGQGFVVDAVGAVFARRPNGPDQKRQAWLLACPGCDRWVELPAEAGEVGCDGCGWPMQVTDFGLVVTPEPIEADCPLCEGRNGGILAPGRQQCLLCGGVFSCDFLGNVQARVFARCPKCRTAEVIGSDHDEAVPSEDDAGSLRPAWVVECRRCGCEFEINNRGEAVGGGGDG